MDIERIKAETARLKAEMADSPPEPRVPTTEEHYAAFKRISDAVCPVLVKYANIVHKHNTAPDFDTEKLEQYSRELNELFAVDDDDLRHKIRILGFGIAAITRRRELNNRIITEWIITAVKSAKGRR